MRRHPVRGRLRAMPAPALAGLGVTLLFVAVAILAPWIAPHGNGEIVGDVWQPLSGRFPLGTDNLGRDMLARMIWSTRVTLSIATLATLAAFAGGASLGLVAAVVGGALDTALSRGVDLVMAIPSLILALVVLSALPANDVVLVLLMGVLGGTRVFRLARAIAADLNVMDFVEAARLRGEGVRWIVFAEVLPNTLTPLVSELGLRFVFSILFLSALSFLGLGVQPPDTDWGGLVRENRDGIVFGIPAALVPAGVIVALTVSVNLVADWVLTLTSGPGRDRGER